MCMNHGVTDGSMESCIASPIDQGDRINTHENRGGRMD